jgi:UDP-N-acetylglucosamine acyltransferase
MSVSAPVSIHPTAMVDPNASLEPGVTVGPYCIVEDHVSIGSGTVLEAGTIVRRYTTIGRENRFGPYAVLGGEPMDLKYTGEVSYLEIGDRNVFKEFVTVNRGTAGGGSLTRIGSDNLLMVYVHVTHDCIIGNHVIIPNGMQMAGHVTVGDYVTFGASVSVHQFCRIGAYAMVGMSSKIARDVLPYSLADGNPVRHYSLNTIGLRRRGVRGEDYRLLGEALRCVRTGTSLEGFDEAAKTSEHLALFLEFVRASSTRGLSGFAGRD